MNAQKHNVMRRYTFYLTLILVLLGADNITAQDRKSTLDSLAHQLESLSQYVHKTSIYLRTSKDIYESMEDLWFKAYSVDIQQQLLSMTDQTLYVQLVHADRDTVVWEELYPIEDGIASGNIYLDNSFPQGAYWLCAYSAHSFDKENDHFIDARRIEIVEDFKELMIPKKKDNATVDSSENTIQFDLFPEGGYLLSGITNKIAFKAVDRSGLPRSVSGTLLEDNKALSTFESTHDGMGSFTFCPQTGKNYAIRLDEPYTDSIYSLPQIKEEGLSLRLVENQEDQIAFWVYNKGVDSRRFYVQLQTRGLPAVMAASEIQDSTLIKLPLTDVGPGISEITLFDDKLTPLAERLIYLRPESQILIKTKLSRKTVGKREKISLKIQTTDREGRPIVAQLGATVYDRLYYHSADPKDIQTHYQLSNHLRGNIHNPAYYFDTANVDRLDALDLLLLTQGWRSYEWNESNLKEFSKNTVPVLSDGVTGKLIPKGKKDQQAVMIFDPEQKESVLLTIDSNHTFFIPPENMYLGANIYIKHFGEPEDFDISVDTLFETIRGIEPWKDLTYPQNERPEWEKVANKGSVPVLDRGSIKIEEVIVTEKQETAYRDKYIGYLDSLAKYADNSDRIHGGAGGGWLNCPVGDSKDMPVEGTTYLVWVGPNPPTSHPFTFGANDVERVVYHYPKYTEEELMERYGIARSKGYYPKKEFYEPVYDKENDAAPDYRNTLLWAPEIITNENGTAQLEFYSSDIHAEFYGIIEGIDEEGSIGKSEFHFTVSE